MAIIWTIPFLFFFSLTAQVADPYANIKKNCIDSVEWKNKRCYFVANEEFEHPDWVTTYNNLGNSISDTLGLGAFVISTTLQFPIVKLSEGEMKRLSIISLLKSQVEKEKLNECQKASLVKCASAHSLEYKECLSSELGSVALIYQNGKGVCNSFNRVYEDLARALGLEVEKIASSKEDHAYNKVKIDGVWYYAEPQANNTDFIYINSKNKVGEVNSSNEKNDLQEKSKQSLTPEAEFNRFQSTMTIPQ